MLNAIWRVRKAVRGTASPAPVDERPDASARMPAHRTSRLPTRSRHLRLPSLRVLLPTLAVVLACATDAPVGPRKPPICTGRVTGQAGPGTTPTITWTPNCSVHRIQVLQETVGGQYPVWEVFQPYGIAPGVRYGESIPDAIVVGGPDPIVAGRRVNVLLITQYRSELTVVGTATFMP